MDHIFVILLCSLHVYSIIIIISLRIICNRINKTVVALLKYELNFSLMISILLHTFIMYIVSVAHSMPVLPINNIFQINP